MYKMSGTAPQAVITDTRSNMFALQSRWTMPGFTCVVAVLAPGLRESQTRYGLTSSKGSLSLDRKKFCTWKFVHVSTSVVHQIFFINNLSLGMSKMGYNSATIHVSPNLVHSDISPVVGMMTNPIRPHLPSKIPPSCSEFR